jgi:putative polyketide hydroxylase
MNISSHHSGYDETPVLIAGGSLIGLSTSLFLSRQGIPSLLVERHAGTAIHPRLASMTARSMEIFRAAGVEAAIRQVEPPFSLDSTVPLVESLVGQEVDHNMDDFSAYFTNASPVQGSLIAQDVLEPALRAQIEQAGANLRYGAELIGFEQDEKGVTATVRELSSGTTRQV